MEITGNGKALVRAPEWMVDSEIQKFVHQKSDWLEKHLRRIEERTGKIQPDYRRRRAWLKENGGSLIDRMMA